MLKFSSSSGIPVKPIDGIEKVTSGFENPSLQEKTFFLNFQILILQIEIFRI